MRLMERVPAELFERNREAVENANREMFRKTSLILGVVLSSLALFSVLVRYWRAMTPLYAAGAILSAFAYAYARAAAVRKKGAGSCLPAAYAYLLALFSLTILMAVRPGDRGTLSPFMAALLYAPVCVLDRPRNLGALLAVCVTALGAAAFWRLPAMRAAGYLYSAVVFGVIGLLIGSHLTRMKLEGFEARRQLLEASHLDALTKLPNRRSLFERLALLEKSEDARLTGVVMVDIDHFKQYNDSLGHQMGDDCLGALGETFAAAAAGEGLTAYRYGGEEFIFLRASGCEGRLSDKAEALRRAVSERAIPFPGQAAGIVTISAGYAGAIPGEGYEQCISRADQALYFAKQNGRNRVAGWNREITASCAAPRQR